jgi:ATP-binding cassette subfamily B protein
LRPEVRLAILDEPFRGLHRSGRRELLKAARRLWSGATVVVVTHDLSETLDFDRVVVVEGGRIVEQGEPQALLDRPDGAYRRLLDAEKQQRQELWGSDRWRVLHLADGRLREGREGA